MYAHTNVTREYNSDNNVSRRENGVFPRRLKYSSIRPTKHLHIEWHGKRAWRKYSRMKKKGKSGKKYKKSGGEKKQMHRILRDMNSPARHFLIRPAAKSPKRRTHYFGNYANNSFCHCSLSPSEDGRGVILITAAFLAREQFPLHRGMHIFHWLRLLKTRRCTNVREPANPLEIAVRQINGECL